MNKSWILFQCVLKRAICTVHYSLDREQNSILEKSAFLLSKFIFPVYVSGNRGFFLRIKLMYFDFLHFQWSLDEKEKYILNITRVVEVKK